MAKKYIEVDGETTVEGLVEMIRETGGHLESREKPLTWTIVVEGK